MQKSSSFTELLFSYDDAEYQRWRSGDKTTIQALLEQSGPMGRTIETYFNQAGSPHNYPEVRYGGYLVEREDYPKENVFYENYTLSFQSVQNLAKSSIWHAKGAHLLHEVFSDKFFIEFDRLYDLNEKKIGKTREGTVVDLCAVNVDSGRVAFCETKKYDCGKKKTEHVGGHQLLALAFVGYIVDTLKDQAFQNKAFKVQTRLVAFACRDDLEQDKIQPKTYTVQFDT